MTAFLRTPPSDADLNARGWALTGPLLDAEACAALRALYADETRFRSRVVMQRHGFGQGEYLYFADPLPDPLPALREALYEALVPVANDWAGRLARPRFPDRLADLAAACRAAGQTRPTSLMLKYGPATTTGCIRTCTAISSSRFRSPSC